MKTESEKLFSHSHSDAQCAAEFKGYLHRRVLDAALCELDGYTGELQMQMHLGRAHGWREQSEYYRRLHMMATLAGDPVDAALRDALGLPAGEMACFTDTPRPFGFCGMDEVS